MNELKKYCIPKEIGIELLLFYYLPRAAITVITGISLSMLASGFKDDGFSGMVDELPTALMMFCIFGAVCLIFNAFTKVMGVNKWVKERSSAKKCFKRNTKELKAVSKLDTAIKEFGSPVCTFFDTNLTLGSSTLFGRNTGFVKQINGIQKLTVLIEGHVVEQGPTDFFDVKEAPKSYIMGKVTALCGGKEELVCEFIGDKEQEWGVLCEKIRFVNPDIVTEIENDKLMKK